jgi:hypothetical protein
MRKVKIFKKLGLGILLMVLFNFVFAQQGQPTQGGFFSPDTKYRPDVP